MKRDLSISQWKLLVSSLSDAQLLEATRTAAGSERERTAWLVAHLAEVFERDLALQRGYPSLYKYAREELKLSESQAWERVAAARLALEIPETIERLACGELTLDSAGALWRELREKRAKVRKVPPLQAELMRASPGAPALEAELMRALLGAPALEAELMRALPGAPRAAPKPIHKSEKRELFNRVLGKTRRESEAVIREWKEEKGLEPPKPKTQTITFELTEEELEKFERLRDLLTHKLNSRDAKAALLWMIENGLEKVDPVRKEERARARKERGAAKGMDRKEGQANQAARLVEPRQTETKDVEAKKIEPKQDAAVFLARQRASRGSAPAREPVPEAVRRQVWIRDQGKCQYLDPETGRLCGETSFLDLDHILEVRNGGPSTPDNLRLACRAHNRRRHQWE